MFVALTGGIGCGKSTVLTIFRNSGWTGIEADSICHSLYTDGGSGIPDKVLARWGKRILDEGGLISRRKIAEIVFASPEELEWLDSLVHPLVYAHAGKIAEESSGPVIFDVPLLFETGKSASFDKVVAVWAPEALCYERLIKRGLTIQDIRRRMSFQMSAERKLELSDFGLINTGDAKFLRAQCAELIKILT